MKYKKKYFFIIPVLFIITLTSASIFRNNIKLNEKQSEIMKIYYSVPDYNNKLLYYEINWKPKIIFAYFCYRSKGSADIEVKKYYDYLKANRWIKKGQIFSQGNKSIEFTNIGDDTYTYYIYMEDK